MSSPLFEISSQITASIAVAVATAAAGLLSQLLTKRQQAARRSATEDVEAITKALQAQVAARRAAAEEIVAERMPTGLSREQFSELMAEIANRLPSPESVTNDQDSAVDALVNNYHEQALSQARAQFWFSVAAASIGFAWILYAGTGIQPDKFSTVSKTLPGVVMDAVAFLFFRQASETRERATDLYDRLRRDRQMTESAALVSSIEDIRLRSVVKAHLALHMSGLKPAEIDLGSLLSREI